MVLALVDGRRGPRRPLSRVANPACLEAAAVSQCKDCRHYAVGSSECRRHAPVVMTDRMATSGIARAVWPHTDPSETCGDHQSVELTGGIMGHLKPIMKVQYQPISAVIE